MVPGFTKIFACRTSVFANCQKDTVCVDVVCVYVVHASLPKIVFKDRTLGKNPVPISPKDATASGRGVDVERVGDVKRSPHGQRLGQELLAEVIKTHREARP